jgi:6-phosphogluconate dehydrogenase (decarboxylating)
MKLGMVGLGRMGGNMTKRLENDGHTVQTYDQGGTGTAASRRRRRCRSSSACSTRAT